MAAALHACSGVTSLRAVLLAALAAICYSLYKRLVFVPQSLGAALLVPAVSDIRVGRLGCVRAKDSKVHPNIHMH